MTSLSGFSGSKFGFSGPKRLVDPVSHHQGKAGFPDGEEDEITVLVRGKLLALL